MSILQRKLIFNDSELHLILWNNKPGFIVTELTAALDVGKDDIPLFLRKSDKITKGIEYDVIQGVEAADLKNSLSDSGVKKKFIHTSVIYFEGLEKYFLHRKTQQNKDFRNYLIKNKVSLEPLPDMTKQLNEQPIYEQTKDMLAANNNIIPMENDSDNNLYFSSISRTLDFVDEFIDCFNKINITPDKANAFTKSMARFMENKGLNPEELLNEMKKWIV